ncbi:unnamed protein product [Paramecium sonneborni]|uniref:Uncharacterized protein n=1 Tax=Paramecium sonneborni TaxID=65129 RepID=A0A8S1M6T3_9CILI|nr:unnamed protein product [Paramecium sonneborni]
MMNWMSTQKIKIRQISIKINIHCNFIKQIIFGIPKQLIISKLFEEKNKAQNTFGNIAKLVLKELSKDFTSFLNNQGNKLYPSMNLSQYKILAQQLIKNKIKIFYLTTKMQIKLQQSYKQLNFLIIYKQIQQ